MIAQLEPQIYVMIPWRRPFIQRVDLDWRSPPRKNKLKPKTITMKMRFIPARCSSLPPHPFGWSFNSLYGTQTLTSYLSINSHYMYKLCGDLKCVSQFIQIIHKQHSTLWSFLALLTRRTSSSSSSYACRFHLLSHFH